MMRVMSSTSSLEVAALGWAHIYFSGILYYFFGAFGGSRFPQGGTISQLKNYIIFIVPWGHPRGVS